MKTFIGYSFSLQMTNHSSDFQCQSLRRQVANPQGRLFSFTVDDNFRCVMQKRLQSGIR